VAAVVTAASVNNLAHRHKIQGELAVARPLFEGALTMRQTRARSGHPETAISLNNLARFVREQGDLGGAQQFCEALALVIQEKVQVPGRFTRIARKWRH
jgi:hypothetical protein